MESIRNKIENQKEQVPITVKKIKDYLSQFNDDDFISIIANVNVKKAEPNPKVEIIFEHGMIHGCKLEGILLSSRHLGMEITPQMIKAQIP